ncbi:LacI family DNA-binding transcriptional regulator [Hyphomicrobiales bacterium]|nr:LacI family DNA-binding transcriptional regulator [Hyphomicrobiales bacterium]CAH1695295.1 LacI family DNA-binding transcriptional regulator [Hyphomicrobiales bacterium]
MHDSPVLRMEDIAREAGVSLATVSRVFNQPGIVSPDTVDRVRRVAGRLGYTPNLTAGSLAGNRSKIIAAVVPTITNSIFSETIDGLSTVLTENRYQLLLGQTLYDKKRLAELVETFIGRRVDGLVLTGLTRNAALRKRIKAARIPVVETWELGPRPIDMLVGFSNGDAAAAAARHLIDRGRTRLGFIGGMDLRSGARLKGFSAEVTAAGLGAPTVVRIPSPSPSSVLAGCEALVRLLAMAPDVDAIFCSNDMIAMGVLLECQRRGVAVPARVAVMGFSDLPVAQVLVPALTTVQVRAREIGQRAAEQVLARLNSTEKGPAQLDLGFSIVIREST